MVVVVILNTAPLDEPPPGDGFTTVTFAVPAELMSAAVIVAVNCVAFTKLVVRLLAFHCTTLVGTKLLPFTVNVKPVPPAVAEVGEVDVSAGRGLLTVKLTMLESPPLGVGLKTLTGNVPPDAMFEAAIEATNWTLLT